MEKRWNREEKARNYRRKGLETSSKTHLDKNGIQRSIGGTMGLNS